MYKFKEIRHIPFSRATRIPEGTSLEKFRGICGFQYEEMGELIWIELPLFESWVEDKDEFSFCSKIKDAVVYRTDVKRMIPIVAIRQEKGLLYFPEDTKGIKLDYLTLLTKE